MPFDAAVDDVVFQAGDAGDGDGDLNSLVQRGNPPAIGPAAGTSGHAEAIGIDFIAGLQVIEGSNAIPGFDGSRRIAARVPPPHVVVVGAVVDAFDFTHLQLVDCQADVTVAGEPAAVMLVVGFVPVADAVLFHSSVSADIENRRQLFGAIFGDIQVAGDIQTGPRLEVQILDAEFIMLDSAGHHRLQRRSFRQRVQREHFEQLPPIFLSPRLPIVERFDVGQTGCGQPPGF